MAGEGGGGVPASPPDAHTAWSSLESLKKELVTSWLQSQQQQQRCVSAVLKRPVLPDSDCCQDEAREEGDGEGEQHFDAFYDRKPVQAWSHFPLKKSRYDVPEDWNTSSGPGTSGLEPISPPLSHPHHGTPRLLSPPDPYRFPDEDDPSAHPRNVAMTARSGRDRQSPRYGEEGGDGGPEDMNHGNLMREKDLQVIGAETDLAQLFASSSSGEEDNDTQGMELCFPHSRPHEELKCGGHKMHNEANDPPTIAVSELTRMYPTPPSLETNKHSPPDTGTDSHMPMEVTMIEGPVVKAEIQPPARPAPMAIDDPAKFDVFVPSKNVCYVSAPKYCLLSASQLSGPPSGQLVEYKPADWHYGLHLIDHMPSHRGNYMNVPSVEGVHCRSLPSPAFPCQQQRTPRTPMSYELQSPASTPSSYLNKTLHSMDNTGTNSQLPEVHSLLVNILLSDSILNLFRDHNFDSCNVCVCNMDIRGSDMGLYLPDTGGGAESSYKCTCGFSAMVNRRFAFNAGLFYEDEVDITGIRDDRYDCAKPPLHLPPPEGGGGKEGVVEDVPQEVLNLLLAQFASSFPSSCALTHLTALNNAASTSFTASTIDIMGIRDGSEAVYSSLDMARQAQDNNGYPHKMDDPALRLPCLHKWPFIRGAHRLPPNSQDIVQCLKSLQPLLQDAIQYKPLTRLWDKLQGPLSWKDFHQLSGRGSVESSAPQPIPHLLVTHDRDWLAVSPYSVRFWDKQYLEPFSRPRDILYVVVAPDNDFVLQHVRAFFRELSTVYELCRLGRHVPVRAWKDGIFRMGKAPAAQKGSEDVDQWFSLLGDSPTAAKLKLYAQAFRQLLGPLLTQQTLDRSGLDTGSGSGAHKAQFKTPDPAPSHPPTPECSHQSPAPGTTTTPNGSISAGEESKEGQGPGDGSSSSCGGQRTDPPEPEVCEDGSSPLPALVVYVIDPFTYGQDWSPLHRLATIGLLRAFHQMALPPHLHNNTFLQVVPLKTIVDHEDSSAKTQALKALAFSVFTSCRWNLTHTVAGRSLTGFGPAAAADFFIKTKPSEGGSPWRLYSTPYILAPPLAPPTSLMDSQADRQSSVVFFAYCLSHDQRYLLCVATDSRGEMLDSCVINIHIPNRHRRKKASARKHGLAKLWDYILGIVSMSTTPTRIVVGRLGRMGHGELKGWSGLLGKKNLQAANRRMRESCGQCGVGGWGQWPCVQSACVVSLEVNPSFQVMGDSVKQEEKQSSSLPLQTPRDASVTHILVFPTSATAQVNANPLQPGDSNPMDTYDDPLYDIGDVFPDDDLGQEFGNMGPGMEFLDFNFLDGDNFDPQPPSPTSAIHEDRGARQSCRVNDMASAGGGTAGSDPQDDNNLLQQPLAMGYYVSTAPTGPLPPWLWTSCPDHQHVSPVCFKAALHVNMASGQWQEDLDQSPNSANRSSHPLDSTLTCDVLRFVLANYNSLSWLTYDPVSNDRRSCLPLHKLVLMQMYHALHTYL